MKTSSPLSQIFSDIVRPILSYIITAICIGCGIFMISSSASAENPLDKYSCDTLENNEYLKSFNTYYGESGDFYVSLNALKKKYHTEINTEFNTSIADLSRSVYSGDSQEKACAPIQYDQKDNTSLLEFHSAMTKKFWGYECALREILVTKTSISSSKTLTFSEGISSLQTQEFQVVDEIEKSGTALRLSLQMYAEMRQWYPVHRDIECLISEMEIYRNAIRGFIDKVSIMPAKYYNYGSEKQQR